jgi:putative ABC transport system permease protein
MVRGGVMITHGFGRTFDVGIGDDITIDTPKGVRTFPVVGVVELFSAGPTGRIRMHLPFFEELWPKTGSRSVVIWTDGPEEPVIERIAERTKHIQPLFFIREAKILKWIDDLVAESAGLLYLLFAAVAVIAGLAAFNQVTTSMVEWRRDLALLRAAGATSNHLIAIVLAEGLFVATLSATAGLLIGWLSSGALLGVMDETLGWYVEFHAAPGPLAALAAAVIGGCALASLLPGLRARRVSLREELLVE